MVLDYIFDDFPRRVDGAVVGEAGAWLPPPVLQTCHQIRAEGLRVFLTMNITFNINDYNIALMQQSDHWHAQLVKFYDLEVERRIGPAVIADVVTSAKNQSDLWDWLKQFYLHDFIGVFMDQDVYGQKLVRHSRDIQGDMSRSPL